MKPCLYSFALILLAAVSGRAQESVGADPAAISAESQMCISCHETYTPGKVEDWRQSRPSLTTPKMGQAKPELKRRISSAVVPAELQDVVVGTRVISTDLDEATVPVLSHWPNQGVGRINPDGRQDP